jgi:hypothetical protein
LKENMSTIRLKVLSVLALVSVDIPAAFGQRCGKERSSVKTGTDRDASKVDLCNPKATSISDLITLEPPNPLPTNSRFAPTEDIVFVVDATLTDFKLESGSTGDSDYHLVLQDDQGNTMIAEIPSPSCFGATSPFAGQIASVRAKFDGQFTASSSFKTANVPVRVTGVGIFDFFHNQHGAAPNMIEQHPVLDIAFNPGPAAGDFGLSVSPTAIHLHGGSSASVSVSAAPVGGSGPSPNVSYGVSGLPAGVTSRITPGSNGKANLALTATSAAPSGTFPVIVTGSADRRSHSQTIAVNLPGPPETSEEPQWEYRMITATSEQDVVDQSNQLGEQNWEPVSVVRVTGSPAWRAFFKRAKKD